MCKIYFKLLIILLGAHLSFAQNNSDLEIIKDYLLEEGMDQEDIRDLVIQSQSFSKSMRISNVYVTQQYKGISIKNIIGNFAIKNGNVVHFSGKLIDNIQSKVNTTKAQLSAINAVQKAALALDLPDVGNVYEIYKSANANKHMMSKSNISYDEIPVELIYELVGEQLILSWDLSIRPLDNEHWFSLRIDAVDGTMTNKNNWMTDCSFDHDDSAYKKVNNKKKTSFGFNTESDNVSLLMEESYNVYPIPTVESPNHGDRVLITNPANASASPFGWHDTNGIPGAEFTTTRGNNVIASEDADANNNIGGLADGGANLVFDFPFDQNSLVENFEEASITNLFYANNIVHDVWYQYGFDESSGNFQLNNYGNGGADRDEVFAEAQDGSGFNNATFGTPPDGMNPRMQMFLWSPIPDSSVRTFVVNNGTLAGSYETIDNSFDPGHVDAPDFPNGITASLALAIDNDASIDPNDACSDIINTAELNGRIAVIRRGECNFDDKIVRCQSSGAVAVLVVNNDPGDPIAMGGDDPSITIPAVMIGQSDGEALIAQINTTTINVTLSDIGRNFFAEDSSFDNGIVIHEYGHGISTRLAGGANTSNCLNGDEQMGEGWSDWFALMMTIESGDSGVDARGIGTYASGQPITGRGIRPFPYSTNTSINPVTYEDTNNETGFSIPHGVGSVWASILWDMTWAFIERDGFDPDLYNGTGGNNLAMQLVIDGLKLQACNPGFVDGRDGILAAANLLPNSNANRCLIWDVFAVRGVGFSANQGLSTSRIDQIEAFDLPPVSQLNCAVLSTDEFDEDVFQIYPNPSHGNFNIGVNRNIGSSTISIFDLNGRMVYNEVIVMNDTHNIQANLGSGIYLLTIETDSGETRSTFKIAIE